MAVLQQASFIFSLLAVVTIAAASECSRSPPNHVKLECEIVPRGTRCSQHDEGERQINTCDDISCLAWTGVDLIVSCTTVDEADQTSLNLFHNNATQGLPNVSWAFADAAEAEGVYECRYGNGSVYSTRSVIFDDGAYVIPGSSTYDQSCIEDIVPDSMPGYHCNVARSLNRYFAGGPHSLYFNVLGARPIEISVEVIWDDHYPIDLHLSYETEASNTSTIHSATLDSSDIVFIGSKTSVRAYAVITAQGDTQTSTMCVAHQFLGVGRLFPNETLPRDQSVDVGDCTHFQCKASTGYETNDEESVTISFQIRPPHSPHDSIECFNCSITATEVSSCSERDQCFDVEISMSSYGDDDGSSSRLTHTLNAVWSEIDARLDGYEVMCVLAVNGVVQWENSASLTVDTATTTTDSITPHVTPILEEQPSNNTDTDRTENTDSSGERRRGLSVGAIIGISIGALVIVLTVLAVVCVVSVVVVVGRKRGSKPSRLPVIEDIDYS